MATMVKEKRREKKKLKEKHTIKSNCERDQPSLLEHRENVGSTSHQTICDVTETSANIIQATKSTDVIITTDTSQCILNQSETKFNLEDNCSGATGHIAAKHSDSIKVEPIIKEGGLNIKTTKSKLLEADNVDDSFEQLNISPETRVVPNLYPELDLVMENRFEELVIDSNEKIEDALVDDNAAENENSFENIVPSAPMFQEESPQIIHREEIKEKIKEVAERKIKCMPLEDAIRLFGGIEIAEVRAMSEREEAIVEAGPMSGPEHPLVDLLTTFRSSLMAVERERIQLAIGFANEEKFRSTLWKIEKRYVHVSEKCPCGLTVQVKASYEYAELLLGKLPAAKMRLESLLRDVQDSYCHHQHAALLAHCQIEDLISETTQSNKNEIREALSLVLQALRLSDSGPEALAAALQRWARALSAALLAGGDLRQLLFLLHHLFKQTRSVQWAARVIHMNIGDRSAAAQAIALLELLLARPRLESAREATEETEEMWEEVDMDGCGSAVSEGTLRERDLLALLSAFPLRDLVARIVLFTHSDIRRAREAEWGDSARGAGVARAAAGLRALLHAATGAARAHPHYPRLLRRLRALAAHALHALAALHALTRETYTKELELKITAELEAAFTAGIELCSPAPHEVPTTLLSEHAAKDYCIGTIIQLHEQKPRGAEGVPPQPCAVRVRVVAQAALDRRDDTELAKMALDFLFQTGVRRKSTSCKGDCEVTAREFLPQLLQAHPYLHTTALHMVSDLSQVETVEPSSLKPLSIDLWRPTSGEVRAVLEDWSQRCANLVQHLLGHVECTPNIGLSLDAQLAIGQWLCSLPLPTPEWAWPALRRLRIHRADWSLPLDAPAPDPEPTELFATAHALLATSWGHCIPLICSQGVSALCLVAASRPKDAVHCLGPIMLVMAHSPESVSLTPQFSELFTILLNSGPTLVQRALGVGPRAGSDLLLQLMLDQLESTRELCVSRTCLLSAWLHSLWRASLPAAAPLLDAALLACREWTPFDSHATLLLQEENAKEHLSASVRNAHAAPALCESALRCAHAQAEARTQLWARLLCALHQQRARGDRAHVDNALKHIGAKLSAEELVIYRTATAALAAPLQHPAHLTLWRLFFHLYLQRPPNMHESTPPVGPLFFSGLIKSRTLGQIRKRLIDTATYHRNEAKSFSAPPTTRAPPVPTPPSTSKVGKVVKSSSQDSILLSVLTINDLTGESSDNESSQSEEEREDVVVITGGTETDTAKLMNYHMFSEKMIREYLRWLDEGDKVRAASHHADIARFIPEQLDAAWAGELSRRRPRPPPHTAPPTPAAPPPPPPPPPAQTPLRAALAALMRIEDRSHRIHKPTIKSPLDDVNVTDMQSLLRVVDKHLNNIERFAQEWSSEVSRISMLDTQLWELVAVLRVRRSLPVIRKACHNKCPPVALVVPVQEWCISTGAERGVRENRACARAATRRLARPRPPAARAAAALLALTRRVGSIEAAARVAERAWCGAGAAGLALCAPAQRALAAAVAQLAERWLCSDGRLCAELLSRWSGGGSLQEALCGALVAPPRMRLADWPRVYTALLRASLSPQAAFSYLSKFEVNRWSEVMDLEQRRELLDALLTAAQRWGASPHDDHYVLLELVGMHSAALVEAGTLCAHVAACARAAAALRLPPRHLPHLARVAATQVPFDQLGHLLRELGVIWWEARTKWKAVKVGADYTEYAPHMALLLHTLQRAFVATGVALSYAPERVAWYAWGGLQESWAPWVSPHPAAPALLSAMAGTEAYTHMVAHLVDSIHQVMLDCPDSEEYLLQQAFEWAVQTYLNANTPDSTQENHIQASALLAEFAKLPWAEHQWLQPQGLQTALQVCSTGDRELMTWCGAAWRGLLADTWLRGATDQDLPARLATLLHFFTAMPHGDQTLEQATLLPWWLLTEAALNDPLERFFVQYHNPAMPYHELPQFRVVLSACGLVPRGCAQGGAATGVTTEARHRRQCGVSRWVRAACAPPLAAHVHAHALSVLGTIAQLAPYLESSHGETEELLARAVVIMCIEDAAVAALPVWTRWVGHAPAPLTAASLSAASVLTVFPQFAALADACAAAHLRHTEAGGWADIRVRWAACPWRDAAALAGRGRLHAAYGTAAAHPPPPRALRAALLALLAPPAPLHYVDNEVIIALWVCYACRIARECGGAGAGPGEGERGECRGAVTSLLARWGEEPRRSILRVVTLQADTACPTPRHRLLCRLAQCVLTPDLESAVLAYEASCAAVLGTNTDALSWGRAPYPKRLPRLAIRLFPTFENYFKDELDLAPEN